MISHVPALAEQAKTWTFLELWVDPILFPPKVLMLVGDRDGTCRIFNPAFDYKLRVQNSVLYMSIRLACSLGFAIALPKLHSTNYLLFDDRSKISQHPRMIANQS
jgi:hypothetical protein